MTSLHADMTGSLSTSPGFGLIVTAVLFLVGLLLVISVVQTSRATRSTRDEVREIRRLLEERGSNEQGS